jgi:hypothetical protein
MSEHKLTEKSVVQQVGVKFHIQGAGNLEARIKDGDKVQLDALRIYSSV